MTGDIRAKHFFGHGYKGVDLINICTAETEKQAFFGANGICQKFFAQIGMYGAKCTMTNKRKPFGI